MITFRNLFPIGQVRKKELITNCAAMLPNRMQCVKGGTWEVTDDVKKTQRQYCTFHARMLEEELKRNGIPYAAPAINSTSGFSEAQVSTTTETKEKPNEPNTNASSTK
jgi:hypothetical protein